MFIIIVYKNFFVSGFCSSLPQWYGLSGTHFFVRARISRIIFLFPGMRLINAYAYIYLIDYYLLYSFAKQFWR